VLLEAANGIHTVPAPDDPSPALGGVEPAQRQSGGARSLMQPAITLDLVRQDASVWRMGALVFGQFGLGPKWKARQIANGRDRFGTGAGLFELRAVEGVGRHNRPKHLFEALLL